MHVLSMPIDLPNDSLFLFIGIKFSYNTLWLSSFPFPNCSQNLSPPPQPNFMFFSLFQREKKAPKSKQTNPKDKQKTSPKPKPKLTSPNNNYNFKPNQIKTKQEAWNSFFLGQLLLSTGSALKCSWYTQCHSTEENSFQPLPVGISDKQLPVCGWDFVSTSSPFWVFCLV